MTTKATLLRAIRAQCVECFGGAWSEVDGCTSPKCSLYPYRSGKDPKPSAGMVAVGKRLALQQRKSAQDGRSDPAPVSHTGDQPIEAKKSTNDAIGGER